MASCTVVEKRKTVNQINAVVMWTSMVARGLQDRPSAGRFAAVRRLSINPLQQGRGSPIDIRVPFVAPVEAESHQFDVSGAEARLIGLPLRSRI